MLLASLVAGCFDEPTPAIRTASVLNNVYLKEQGLTALTPEVVRDKGQVFVETQARSPEACEVGATSNGAWKNRSELVKVFAPGEIAYLNLDRNALTNVAALTEFTGLKWLRLNDNKLAALPDLKPLANLRRIYLRNNRLAEVPPTLLDLPALTDVDLSGNPIKDVPDWFVAKPGLKNVSLTKTMVTRLPADLGAWKSLQSLQLGELKISADEMARIRRELPDVAIVF